MTKRPIGCRGVALWSAVVLGCGTCIGVQRADSQPRTNTDISVVSGRPLADAVLELERRHGWVVTYEDPLYEFPPDIRDVSATLSSDRRDGRRVVVPQTRSISFTYDGSHPQTVLTALLEHYNASGYGNEFGLTQTGEVLHVVPRISRSADGVPTARVSRLDVPLTIEEADRSVLQLVELVLSHARVVEGLPPLTVGVVPIGLLAETRIRTGATNESARDVLTRVLAETGARLSWQIFCTPAGGTYRVCAFNLHDVQPPT